MTKIDQKILDELAELEVNALLQGLTDPDMRKNPSFLEKVRKFLQQNRLQTQPETPGVSRVKQAAEDIPEFEEIN